MPLNYHFGNRTGLEQKQNIESCHVTTTHLSDRKVDVIDATEPYLYLIFLLDEQTHKHMNNTSKSDWHISKY